VICCVRHIPWILDSIERLLHINRLELSKIFGFESGGTAYSRADGLMSPNGMVGFALQAMKQAMHSPERDRLLLLPYDTLTREPAYALREVYEFTGLPAFQHDFEKVSFTVTEFDSRLGTPGLHNVRPRVGAAERPTILPPDIWRRYEGESIWRDPAFNTGGVRVL
jgi:sulfotransferase